MSAVTELSDFPARLLKRDLLRYVKSRGFSDEDAETKATELLAFVMSEAERFA